MIASGHLEFVSKKSVIHFELPASVITEAEANSKEWTGEPYVSEHVLAVPDGFF
jgi:hypothetical protein